MADVSLIDVCKLYEGNKRYSVTNFNLEIKDKEFIVFVGPSGCGKSTTLRMIAGLEDITKGDLIINGKVVNDLPPKSRGIAMVFQSYALYPHMSVYDNMAFGLKIQRLPKDEIKTRVMEAARILEIEEYLNRKPKALSGGQRQRVALGRAIVRRAEVLLMDEPLSNLDAKLRVQMRAEIIRLHEQIGSTTIYVTHDQTEAMTMASRIVVMKDGFVQQVGSPIEIYHNPINLFVASFIGSPSMNFFNAKIDKNDIVFGHMRGEKNSSDVISGNEKEEFKEAVVLENNDYELVSIIAPVTGVVASLDLKNLKKVKVGVKVATLKVEPNIVNDTEELGEPTLVEVVLNDKDPTLKEVENIEYIVSEGDSVEEGQVIATYHAPVFVEELRIPMTSDMKANLKEYVGKMVIFGTRPEYVNYASTPIGDKHPGAKFKMRVDVAELLGNEYILHGQFAGQKIVSKVLVNPEKDIHIGDTVELVIDLDKANFFKVDTVEEKENLAVEEINKCIY